MRKDEFTFLGRILRIANAELGNGNEPHFP